MAKMIWRPPNPESANGGQGVVGEQRNVPTHPAARRDKLEIRMEQGWFAAELTLREDGITNVHFDDFSVDHDEQWDAEKIKSLHPISKHIRVVSEQLQDEECGILNVNNAVCALRTTGDKEGWHDAVVIEMRKRPHRFGDQVEICTCLFTVRWLDGPGQGLIKRNLTCAQICLLSNKNVETHPLIVDILHRASGGRDMDQENERPRSSASGVSRRRGNADDTYSAGKLVYNRCLEPLISKDTDASQAKDPLEQSELVVDDHSAVTPAVQSEVRGVPSLSSRSSEMRGGSSLSSHSEKFITVITTEIFDDFDHSNQLNQPFVPTQDVPPLSSPVVADSNRSVKNMSVGHFKQSRKTVEATQDVPTLSSPAVADSNRPMKRMIAGHLKQSKQTTSYSLPSSSSADAKDNRAVRRTSINCLRQLKQTVEAQDVPPLSSAAAADSSRPVKNMSVGHLKQSKQTLEVTQYVPTLSSPPTVADSNRPMKRMIVGHLKQSKQTTPYSLPSSSSADAEGNRAVRRASIDCWTQSKQTVETIRDVQPLSSPVAADGNRPTKRMTIDHLKQSQHAKETTERVPPLSYPAAVSHWPMKRLRVDHSKQSKRAVETTRYVPPLSQAASADCNEPKKRMRVEQLQSKQEVETAQDGTPFSSSAPDGTNRTKRKMRGQVESEDPCDSDLSKQRERIFGTKSSGRVWKAKERPKEVSMERFGTKSSEKVGKPKEQPKEVSMERFGTKSSEKVGKAKEQPKEVSMERFGTKSSEKVGKAKEQPQEVSMERFGTKFSEKVGKAKEQPKGVSMERFGTKSSEKAEKAKEQPTKVSMEQLNSAKDSQVQQSPTIVSKANPVADLHVNSMDSIVLTKEGRCDLPVKKRTLKSKADYLEGRQLSRSTKIQAKEKDGGAKTDWADECDVGRKFSEVQVKEDGKDESGGNDGFFRLSSDLDIKEPQTQSDPILMQKMAGSLVAIDENMKAGSEIGILDTNSDGQQSKKVRITVEFDMELETCIPVVEGFSFIRSFPVRAKVTSCSHNYEEPPRDSGLINGAKSETMATTSKLSENKSEAQLSCPRNCPLPKFNDEKVIHASVIEEKGCDSERKEELPRSVGDSFGGSKGKTPSVEPKVKYDSQSVIHAESAARAGNEQDQMTMLLRAGSTLDNAIVLSDEEEEDGVTAGVTIPPASSTRTFSSNLSLSRHSPATTDNEQECGSVHLRNIRARNMSSFIKNVLAKSRCILVIDNLEVDVQKSDVRELFLKFFTEEKIQSVTIPPPHPELNRTAGYVMFSDKEAADRAAGVLNSCVVVSARGKPWVVRTQGQEELDHRRANLVDDALDGDALSTENFKVLTKTQGSKYHAARNRQRAFCEHQNQTRVMFQVLATEEAKLDS